MFHAQDSGLEFQKIERRFQQQHISAAVHQAARLFGERIVQFVEGDIRQHRVVAARKPPRGTHAPDHKTRTVRRGEAVSRGTCQRGGILVERVDLRFQTVFGETEMGAVERVRFHGVATCREEASVDILNHVRPGAHEDFVAPVQAAKIAGRKIVALDGGSHRAIEDEYAGFKDCQEGVAHEQAKGDTGGPSR